MNSLNRVELIGRLTRDPELRYSRRGNAFTRLGLALTRWDRSEGEGREVTDFLDLVVFGNLAERVPSFASKGAVVYLVGKLRQTQVPDSERHELQVMVDQIELLASGKTQQQAPAPVSRPSVVRQPEPEVRDVDPDDIPL